MKNNKNLLIVINSGLAISILIPTIYWLFKTVTTLFDGVGVFIGELIIVFSFLIALGVFALSIFSIVQLMKNKFSKLFGISIIMLIVNIISAIPNSIGFIIAYRDYLDISDYVSQLPRCFLIGCPVPDSLFLTTLAYLQGVLTTLLILNIIFTSKLRGKNS
jgi:hypothetical protein